MLIETETKLANNCSRFALSLGLSTFLTPATDSRPAVETLFCKMRFCVVLCCVLFLLASTPIASAIGKAKQAADSAEVVTSGEDEKTVSRTAVDPLRVHCKRARVTPKPTITIWF